MEHLECGLQAIREVSLQTVSCCATVFGKELEDKACKGSGVFFVVCHVVFRPRLERHLA
jgi:hypothetical protein